MCPLPARFLKLFLAFSSQLKCAHPGCPVCLGLCSRVNHASFNNASYKNRGTGLPKALCPPSWPCPSLFSLLHGVLGSLKLCRFPLPHWRGRGGVEQAQQEQTLATPWGPHTEALPAPGPRAAAVLDQASPPCVCITGLPSPVTLCTVWSVTLMVIMSLFCSGGPGTSAEPKHIFFVALANVPCRKCFISPAAGLLARRERPNPGFFLPRSFVWPTIMYSSSCSFPVSPDF